MIAGALLLAACLPEVPPGGPVPTDALTLEGGDFLDLVDGAGTSEDWDLRFDGEDLFLSGGESGDGRAGG
ncbi:MAG: hypothetical protein H8E48_06530, partial [Chloroflexi bacterium]|nr:hypothetical protein [Chloroflexota bacterium]